MRSPFPLKKGEGMKRKTFVTDALARKISPLALLGRNDRGASVRDPFDCAARHSLTASLRVTGWGAYMLLYRDVTCHIFTSCPVASPT